MNNNIFSLEGKIAVVTGGSGMYGKQIVLGLANAGAKVYIASRNLEKNTEVAKEMAKKGLNVVAAEMDMSNEESILKLRDEIKTNDGKLDILVNNSVFRVMHGYNDTKEAFDQSMSVNAGGLFVVTRAFGDLIAENNGGSIINIGSYMGILGPDLELYKGLGMVKNGGMSPDYFFHKGGMTNLTRFLASHYGNRNVRCNVLELGGLFNNQNEVFVERYCARTLLGRMANDTDLMGVVVFLASDASSYITGAVIPVDGGYSAK